MKYLLFIVVAIACFCVVDYCLPNEVQSAQNPTITANADVIPSSCQRIPLFIDNTPDETTLVRSRWFPGKNILNRIRNHRKKNSSGSCGGSSGSSSGSCGGGSCGR